MTFLAKLQAVKAQGSLVLLFFLTLGFTDSLRAAEELGRNWREVHVHTNRFQALTFGGGQFVAISEARDVLASTNGQEWRFITRLPRIGAYGYTGRITGLAYARGQYMAVSDFFGWLFISSNLTDWATHSLSVPLHEICGTVDGFITTGVSVRDFTESCRVFKWRESDGWSQETLTNVPPFTSLVAGPNLIAAVGGGRPFHTDAAGKWVEGQKPADSGSMSRLAYGNGAFVAVGQEQGEIIPIPGSRYPLVTYLRSLYQSTNAHDWQYRGYKRIDGKNPPNGVGNYFSIAFGKGRFLAVGTHIGISSNGMDWVEAPNPVPVNTDEYLYPLLVAYGPGCFVMIFDKQIYTSGVLRAQPYLPPDEVALNPNGSLRIRVDTEPNAVVQLRTSEDLVSWKYAATFTNIASSTEIELPASAAASQFIQGTIDLP